MREFAAVEARLTLSFSCRFTPFGLPLFYDCTQILCRESNVKEGERLRLIAMEEEEETRLKGIRDKDRAKQCHQETLQANRALHVFKLKELEREKQTEQAIIGLCGVWIS